MSSRQLVEFVGQAATDVPEDLKQQFADEVELVLRAFLQNEPPSAITVRRCFTSFTPDFVRRTVFGVEVRTANRYQTHIVKVGERHEVERDAINWQACTRKGVASRIFAPVIPIPLPDANRFAVVYQDGYTVFGPNRDDDQPRNLEVISGWAVNDDKPTVPSVERAIANVFADLGRWLFPYSTVDTQAAFTFYRGHLKCDSAKTTDRSGKSQQPVLQQWAADESRATLRRDVVWVVSGRDKPELNPALVRYLDPVEYLEWVLAEPSGKRLPETLVGSSHGDLHARNLLLGVRRGEAEYPVAFDYGEMGIRNVLAWDFVKLECELIRRLLPPLLEDANIRESLVIASKLRPKLAADNENLTPYERTAMLHRRKSADRIRAAVAFHELLHLLTSHIESETDVERLNIPMTSTGIPKVDRLLTIILRIRREAAYWLGFQRGRNTQWLDELYFGIAVHGLLNVRWKYERPEVEVTLIGAGVALARMPSTPQVLRAGLEMGQTATKPFPSYWVPLAITHRLWSANNHPAADDFITREVTKLTAIAGRLPIREEFQHAIPLICEALLIQMEVGNIGGNVEEQLDNVLRPLAREFGDFETLGRTARLFKDAGDKKWEESKLPYDQFATSAGWQMYKKSFKVYAEAFAATDDYYVGVNAATLAFLTHDLEAAKSIAGRVAKLCADNHDHEKDNRYWLFATEGEAALIGGHYAKAFGFYQEALIELSEWQGGMAASTYKQVCRIAKAMGEDDPNIAPILALFESKTFTNPLPGNYLGRKWSPLGSNSQPESQP